MAGGGPEVIDLCSSDDEKTGGSATASVPKRPRRVSTPTSPPSTVRTPGAVPPAPASDDDEIEIVSVKHGAKGKGEEENGNTAGTSNSPEANEGKENAEDDDNDEDLVVVNETTKVRANVDYPHLRFSCGVHPFARSARMNRLHCVKCYCYVCDGPASDCTMWSSHCAATDKQARWRTARTKARAKKGSAAPSRKKTSRDYFVRRGANRNNSSYSTTATSVAISGAESVGSRARTVVNSVRARAAAVHTPSFQESVLAIIGQQPGLTAAAAGLSIHRHHTSHTPQVAGALDALDAALMLRWPPPRAPQVAALELPPLTQAPRSAPSHRIVPLPSPNSVLAPMSAPSTPAAASTTLLSQMPIPLPDLPALANGAATAQAEAPRSTQGKTTPNDASNQTPAQSETGNISRYPSSAALEAVAGKVRARIRPTFNTGPRLVPLAPAPPPIAAHVPPPVEPAPGPVPSSNDTPDLPRSPTGLSPQPMQGVSTPTQPPKESTLQRRDVSSPASSENSADSFADAERMRLRAQAGALDPLSTLMSSGLGLGGPDGSTSA